MLYLDHQYQTKIHPKAKDVYLRHLEGNAMEAPYQHDASVQEYFDICEEEIKHYLGLGPSAVMMPISSSSEGFAHILHSLYLEEMTQTGKNQVLTLTTEDAGTLLAIEQYHPLGIISSQIPVNEQGFIDLDTLEKYVTPKTTLLSFSWAHRLTGVVQPIAEISQFCRDKGIFLHIDISIAIGAQYFELQDLGIDFVTIEGSRIGAPIGTGLLVIQNDRKFTPFMPSSIKGILRGGPIPIGGWLACMVAIKERYEQREQMTIEVAQIRNRFEKVVRDTLKGTILFNESERIPHISCFALPGISGELLAFCLSERDIFVSFGGGQVQRLEYILKESQVDPFLAKSAISVCFDTSHTLTDMKEFVGRLEEIQHQYTTTLYSERATV